MSGVWSSLHGANYFGFFCLVFANSMGSFELGCPFGITPVEAKVLRLWIPMSAHHWPQLVSFFFFEFYFFYFFIQQVLISYLLTHISVYTSIPISQFIPPPPPPATFPPWCPLSLFSTSVSLFLPCKPVHLYHFSRFHIYALIYDILFFSF